MKVYIGDVFEILDIVKLKKPNYNIRILNWVKGLKFSKPFPNEILLYDISYMKEENQIKILNFLRDVDCSIIVLERLPSGYYGEYEEIGDFSMKYIPTFDDVVLKHPEFGLIPWTRINYNPRIRKAIINAVIKEQERRL